MTKKQDRVSDPRRSEDSFYRFTEPVPRKKGPQDDREYHEADFNSKPQEEDLPGEARSRYGSAGVARYPKDVGEEGRRAEAEGSRYRRPDRDIAEEIQRKLGGDATLNVSEVQVGVREGHIVLEGQVDSDYSEQRIREICEDTLGVEAVISRLKISGPDRSSYQTSGSRGMH